MAATPPVELAVLLRFDSFPGGPDGPFIDAETEDGRGVRLGGWIRHDDGTWALRVTAGDVARAVAGDATRRARRFGPLLLTTCRQSSAAPRVDAATVRDADGRRYQALVFGTGAHAVVAGWRSTGPGPVPSRWALSAPRPLRPVARFLFTPRPAR